MGLCSTIDPASHIELESIPSASYKHPISTPETDPDDPRKIGTLLSGYNPPRTESTTSRDLESSKPNSHHGEGGEEQAVGLVPSINK